MSILRPFLATRCDSHKSSYFGLSQKKAHNRLFNCNPHIVTMTSSLLAHRAAGASQAAAASRRAANVKAVAATATRAPPSVDFSYVGSPSTYSFVENNPGGEFDAGFSDYVKATQKLAEMQRLSQALLSNLEEINSLSLQTLVRTPL